MGYELQKPKHFKSEQKGAILSKTAPILNGLGFKYTQLIWLGFKVFGTVPRHIAGISIPTSGDIYYPPASNGSSKFN